MAVIESLKKMLQDKTDLTLEELRLALKLREGSLVTAQAIHYALKDEKITHKKKSRIASLKK